MQRCTVMAAKNVHADGAVPAGSALVSAGPDEGGRVETGGTERSAAVGGDPASVRARLPGRRAWLALVPLLTGTFLGTVNNNIVNVPLRDILTDLAVPLSQGVLVVVAFSLTFAVLMPLTGWLGDRLGRRRVFLAALLGLAVGASGASVAPTLPALVAFRVIQGASTAAVLPTVMGLISDLFDETRRGRAMGLWATVNGLGQAVGPPFGGAMADLLTWRSMFLPIIPLALLAFAATLRLVPSTPGRAVPLDRGGALTLTLGATLAIAAVTAVPQTLPAYVAPALGAGAGAALFAFARSIRRARHPFVSPQLVHDRAYLRSSLAVFAQMFCLGATILGVPLHLTQEGMSTAVAGLFIFALPAVMSVLAPVAGYLTDSRGGRAVIRSGLIVLAASELLLATGLATGYGQEAPLVAVLLLIGTGIALVQTPAATGATRSPSGRVGAGLGLFNLVRFSGSALGAAVVAIVLQVSGSFSLLFAACAVMAALGLAGTFAGPADARTGRQVAH